MSLRFHLDLNRLAHFGQRHSAMSYRGAQRAVNRRAARGASGLNGGLGGTAATDSTNRLRMTMLFVPGPKCPPAQAASNDHCNPGNPHWHVETSDLHRPLIQSPHSLNHRYHAEENT
jgi:hypothetical protein